MSAARQRAQAERDQDGEGRQARQQVAALRLRELQVDADDNGERAENGDSEDARQPPVDATPPYPECGARESDAKNAMYGR